MRNRGRVYHTHRMSRHHIQPLPLWLVGWFVTLEDLWRGGNGSVMALDRKIEPPHFDEHGRFIHPCCVCGDDAGLGFGVNLLKGQLGTWYCGECASRTGPRSRSRRNTARQDRNGVTEDGDL